MSGRVVLAFLLVLIFLFHSLDDDTVPFENAKRAEVTFKGDKLTITPSSPDATYIWDYENTTLIYDKYYTPGFYLKTLVYMYEDYNFMAPIAKTPSDGK